MKEIIKGIIAEMREFIENPTIGTETEREVKLEKYLKGCMKGYADRIEVVVAKKETTTPTCKDSLQVGDMAKMREALRNADIVLSQTSHGYHSPVRQEIKAALSAPARNCDRFADELDAQIEFLNDVWLISVTKDTMLERDKFENWTEEMKSRYAKWLFAEAKGEAK